MIFGQNQNVNFEFKEKYLKFIPSGMSLQDIRPSDIPSKQVLIQMGFSEKEISEILDFKFSREKFKKTNSNKSLKKIESTDDMVPDIVVRDTTNEEDFVLYPKAKIYGQDIFRNNSLSFYQKSLDAKAPENYKVGPGDEISISIWGYSEFTETLIVDERGYISPSSYGRIYVKGLTFMKMRSLLKSKFSSFLDMKNSEIDVTLSYSRVITVNIVGEVYHPGSYLIPAINTAFNALIASKGPNQLGTVRNIYIKRNGEIVDSLDVYQFLFNPEANQDIYMQDGDYIFVPPAKNIIEIKGAVNRPYTYEGKDGESVGDLINYAGGYSQNAFSDIITLRRVDYNSLQVNDVYKDDINSTIIKHGDELIINTISNKLSNVVSVKTSVGVSGDYQFIKGERLLDLLERSKCIDNNTFLNKVYIIRNTSNNSKSHISINLESIINDYGHEDNILLNEYDIVRVLSIDDFSDEFYVSVKGCVRKPGNVEFGDGMNLQDVLLQCGGLTQQAEDSRIEVSRVMDYDIEYNQLNPIRTVIKTIDIGKNLILGKNVQNFKLHPLDQIFVRKNPDFIEPINITLFGEIRFPGQYSILSNNEQISSVIKRAGGLTESAYVDGARMYRKFNLDIDKSTELNIPNSILDSIIKNPNLKRLYDLELLEREISNSNNFLYDSISYDIVYFDLNKAMSNNKSYHNLSLKDGDSIVIPRILDVVKLTGELNNIEGNSISVPFFGKRANYYVKNFAGGYSQENRKSNTIVIHPNGVTRKTMNFGLFTISPKVKPGSTIKVLNTNKLNRRKKKEDVDYNRHIESVITKITGVLSLYLLVERLNNGF